ncbi:MAG: hypothetical protein ABJC79_01065 [Acidimicrobiia bacterium]
MNPLSVAGGILGGRLKSRSRLAFGLTAALTGLRVFRRLTKQSDKPAIRFQVKSGEVYEIRGIRRGQ